jgi:hypothetical protein
MKRYAWILLAVCLTGFEVWVVLAPLGPLNFDNHPLLLSLILGAFTASGLGGWWMLFRIVRKEKHLFPLILIPILIPNSFLWYYFEKISPAGGMSD